MYVHVLHGASSFFLLFNIWRTTNTKSLNITKYLVRTKTKTIKKLDVGVLLANMHVMSFSPFLWPENRDPLTLQNTHIKPRTSWKGGHIHQEDILAVAYCPPNILATASFDGEICLWSMETEMLFRRMRRRQTTRGAT